MKTAKEMFEEYGLKYKESFCNKKMEQIMYLTDDEYSPQVIFTLCNQTYKVFYNKYSASNIDMELHKAINKQIEELGWNLEG